MIAQGCTPPRVHLHLCLSPPCLLPAQPFLPQIYDQFGEEGLKGGAPPPGTPPEGGFGGAGGFAGPGGGAYQMDDETARRIFEGLFGGGLGGMFGGMGGGGMGGGGAGGPRVRIFQTGKKRGRPDFEGEGGLLLERRDWCSFGTAAWRRQSGRRW